MQRIIILFAIATFLALYTINSTFASAWTLGAGKVQTFETAYFYISSEFFNQDGDALSQPAYHKMEVSELLEYGVNNEVTIGTKFSVISQYQNNEFFENRSSGVSDPEFFVRYRMWKNTNNILSIQPLIKIFIADDSAVLPLSTGANDVELRGLWGRSYQWRQQNHFTNLELAYRKRGGGVSNEIIFDATAGFTLIDGLELFAQSFMTIAQSRNSVSFSNSTHTDFNLTKLQLSIVKQITQKYSVQFGAYQDVIGKNIGKGTGVLLSVWTRF